MPLKPGRIIPLMVGSGSLQMAIDTWLLSQHDPEQWSLVLRFYHWQPAAISLGYGQRHWPDRWQSVTWQGQSLPLIRRPTGGRGVLHQGDLCYALVTAPTAKGKANRTATYHHLCRFLQVGWAALGFPLRYGADRPARPDLHQQDQQSDQQSDQQQAANCFSLKTSADLQLSNGCKWIGSAQRWRSGSPEVVLQHGAMRLSPDPNLWQTVFGVPLPLPPDRSPIPSPETIVSKLTQTASDCFETALIVQPLSEAEWHSIKTIQAAREKDLGA